MPVPVKSSTREEREFTPNAKRNRTIESLLDHVPDGADPVTYFAHLYREHGLRFDRGEGTTRLYSLDDVIGANQDCQATCAKKKPTLHRARIDQAIATRKTKKKRTTSQMSPSPQETPATPTPPKQAPRKRIASTPAKRAKEFGLVNNRDIARRYGVAVESFDKIANLMTQLRDWGLRTVEDMGYLYDPIVVDQLAAEHDLEIKTDWPNHIKQATT